MENYATLSLETHLFFARIMKEHGLFLEAGFVCADKTWIEKADWFRRQFEELLRDTVQLANRRVNSWILDSQELVTEFTIPAEECTEKLSGVLIDSGISRQEKALRPGQRIQVDRELVRAVDELNRRALRLLNQFIEFKKSILREVGNGRLFTVNYPLLVEHILREARLYCTTVEELLGNRELSYKNLRKTERFWNQIMMEHALFIRGLLDPTEDTLIQTANQFAVEYGELLRKARKQDCRAMGMTEEALAETMKIRDFKAAGAKGILKCEIASIILPLLADHVLREANHYIRLLETGKEG